MFTVAIITTISVFTVSFFIGLVLCQRDRDKYVELFQQAMAERDGVANALIDLQLQDADYIMDNGCSKDERIDDMSMSIAFQDAKIQELEAALALQTKRVLLLDVQLQDSQCQDAHNAAMSEAAEDHCNALAQAVRTHVPLNNSIYDTGLVPVVRD